MRVAEASPVSPYHVLEVLFGLAAVVQGRVGRLVTEGVDDLCDSTNESAHSWPTNDGSPGASIVRDRRDASARRRREMMVAVALCLHLSLIRTNLPTFLGTACGRLPISVVLAPPSCLNMLVMRPGVVGLCLRALQSMPEQRAAAKAQAS